MTSVNKKFKPDELLVYSNKGTGVQERVYFRKYMGDLTKCDFAVVERTKLFHILVVKTEDLSR